MLRPAAEQSSVIADGLLGSSADTHTDIDTNAGVTHTMNGHNVDNVGHIVGFLLSSTDTLLSSPPARQPSDRKAVAAFARLTRHLPLKFQPRYKFNRLTAILN